MHTGAWVSHLERMTIRVSVVVTYLLFCVFGVASWIALNGVWAEISVLVLTLPECGKLPAILVVVTQLANIGPLVYTGVRYAFQRLSLQQVYLEITTVFILLAVGGGSCVLLAIFWSDTVQIFGSEHSLALIVLTFTLALVDCTSSLVFIPFLKHFPMMYISALYIGEGMSGVLPSVAALSQGFVNNSLKCMNSYPGVSELGIFFSPSIYFLFLAVIMLVCGAAFTAIVVLPLVRSQMLSYTLTTQTSVHSETSTDTQSEDDAKAEETDVDIESNDEGVNFTTHQPLVMTARRRKCFHILESCPSTSPNRCTATLLILQRNFVILTCLAVLSFLTNGSLNAISAFAYLPYGNTTYHVAINLGLLANPIAILFYVMVSHKSKLLTVLLSSMACLLAVYVLISALLSPNPPLTGSPAGSVIIILVSVAISACVAYTKVGVIVQLYSREKDRDTALFLSGLFTQFGSLLGALLFFGLVYFTDLFTL